VYRFGVPVEQLHHFGMVLDRPVGYADTYPDANSYTHADTHSDSYANTHPDAHSNAYPDSNTHTYADTFNFDSSAVERIGCGELHGGEVPG
jgi:hypothetical protein